MGDVAVGPASLVDDAPVVVEVDGGRYVLAERDGAAALFSAVCPHQRGRVRVADDETLLCPNHRWQFDAETGACTSGADASLTEVAVVEDDGTLYASLP